VMANYMTRTECINRNKRMSISIQEYLDNYKNIFRKYATIFHIETIERGMCG
jgi:hypothetical protein